MSNAVTAADFQPLMLDLMLVYGAIVLLGVDLFMAHGRKRLIGAMAVALFTGVFALSFFVSTDGTAFFGAYEGGPWPLFVKRVVLVAAAVASLGCLDFVDRHFTHRQGEFYLLMTFAVLGMTLLPGVRSLVLLVVCFELMGMPLAILASFAKNDDESGPNRHAPEAGFKLYLVGAASTAVTLFGLSLVYGVTGETTLAALAGAPVTPLFTLGMLMMLAGMAFKVGAVPFHMWVPDTYQGAGTPFVAFLSVAPKVAGFAALAVLFVGGFGDGHPAWARALLVITVATLVVGNLLALPQTNAKRLLAYSGIAQVGYMLIALVVGGEQGTGVLLFYLAGYVVTNIGVFLIVEAVAGHAADAEIHVFDGLWQRSPALALSLLLFLLSLAGIPFVVGFWAKLYVFLAAYEAGFGWLVLLGAVLAVVGLFYYLRIAIAAYGNPPTQDEPIRVALPLRLAIVLCTLAVVGMGAWPRPFIEGAMRAAKAFISA